MPGCGAQGEYRAPKSRQNLHEYWWFCLEHVRAYNSSWDYYKGMSPAEFEQVFTPFYRRRGAGNGTGNGLGLSLVRQIARRHGGDARCLALDDGRGCFLITLAGAIEA